MMKFTPLIREKVRTFLQEKETLFNLVDGLGSPLNVIFPIEMKENIQEFNAVFKKHFIKGRIFYAHKTNKSNAIVRQGSFEDISIDVASEKELKSALNNGFAGERIEATGPKNKSFILLGLQHNIIFNVDNLQELQQILELRKAVGKLKKTKILLRFSGFKSEGIKVLSKDSKFGISTTSLKKALDILKEYREYIDFLGFSFHLDTVELKEKVIAVENCLDFFEVAQDYDFEPRILNIGGGYKVCYLADEKEWHDSISYLKESILGLKEPVTWNGNSFGLQKETGVLKGGLNIYHYYDQITGAKYLDALLSTPLAKHQNRTIGTILSENMIDLYIEPGKAMVNQMGLTAAKVNFVKESANNEILIGLDLKRSDIVMADQELFIDPVVLPRTGVTPLDTAKGVYFTGNLCLESDLIFKHKVYLDYLPNIGDILVFLNTAGYFMDFNATDSIMQPIARKIAVVENQGKFKWYSDEIYNPIEID